VHESLVPTQAASSFDAAREFALVKRMGLNTVRLEGKLPSDEWFAAADAAGVMVIPGLECCDAWQHWSSWDAVTTAVARESVGTMARRLRGRPSMLMFAYSSDELPPPGVEKMYVSALCSTRHLVQPCVVVALVAVTVMQIT
jgi:exo-1,4-beta-D-glucosaminidase